MARLVIVGVGGATADLASGSTCVVGRLQSCGLQLKSEPQSSRQHFEIERHGTRWVLHDLGSRNGTLLNGERVDGRAPLTHGDKIRVGVTVVTFEAAPPPRAPGTILGSCELLGYMGRTPAGSLYAAKQGSLERDVFVELVDPDLAGDPEFRARYQERARLAGSFDHPAIQAVYDTSSGGVQLYTVFEACPGPTLEALLKQAPPDRERSLELLGHIAMALAHVHGRGKRHGAVTPRVVVICTNGIKLTGTGEPNRLSAHRPDRSLQVAYASPEESQGNPATDASDIYALGVLAFRLLAGELPYSGKAKEVLKLHASAESVPLPPALDADLQDILGRLLCKAPSGRPSASGLADELTKLAQGGGPRSAPRRRRKGSGHPRGGRSSARNRLSSSSARNKTSGKHRKGTGRQKQSSVDSGGSLSSSSADRRLSSSSADRRLSSSSADRRLSSSSADRRLSSSSADRPLSSSSDDRAAKRSESAQRKALARSAESDRLRQLAPSRGEGPPEDGSVLTLLRLILLGIGYILMAVAASLVARIGMHFLA